MNVRRYNRKKGISGAVAPVWETSGVLFPIYPAGTHPTDYLYQVYDSTIQKWRDADTPIYIFLIDPLTPEILQNGNLADVLKKPAQAIINMGLTNIPALYFIPWEGVPSFVTSNDSVNKWATFLEGLNVRYNRRTALPSPVTQEEIKEEVVKTQSANNNVWLYAGGILLLLLLFKKKKA